MLKLAVGEMPDCMAGAVSRKVEGVNRHADGDRRRVTLDLACLLRHARRPERHQRR